jgi:hypothetical protein
MRRPHCAGRAPRRRGTTAGSVGMARRGGPCRPPGRGGDGSSVPTPCKTFRHPRGRPPERRWPERQVQVGAGVRIPWSEPRPSGTEHRRPEPAVPAPAFPRLEEHLHRGVAPRPGPRRAAPRRASVPAVGAARSEKLLASAAAGTDLPGNQTDRATALPGRPPAQPAAGLNPSPPDPPEGAHSGNCFARLQKTACFQQVGSSRSRGNWLGEGRLKRSCSRARKISQSRDAAGFETGARAAGHDLPGNLAGAEVEPVTEVGGERFPERLVEADGVGLPERQLGSAEAGLRGTRGELSPGLDHVASQFLAAAHGDKYRHNDPRRHELQGQEPERAVPGLRRGDRPMARLRFERGDLGAQCRLLPRRPGGPAR